MYTIVICFGSVASYICTLAIDFYVIHTDVYIFYSYTNAVVASDEADLASNSSLECADNPNTLAAETASPVNNARRNGTCSNKTLKVANRKDSSDHSRDTTPVADSDQNKQRNILQREKNGHQMQFFSNGFTNGLSSSVTVNYHLKQPISLYTFKPEVIANPLLLLASCATQLHKAHTTLPANRKKAN